MKKRRKAKSRSQDTFEEAYVVSLDYRKPDGYWVHEHKEDVFVVVEHGISEKSNHAAAEIIARQLYPGCRINSVSYV